MKDTSDSSAGAQDMRLGKTLGFMRLLWTIDHGLQSLSKRMEASLGATGPQRLVLRIVGRFPGIWAGRIAALLALDPSTLTGVLQRLEKRGLIERSEDPDDRRRALFRLTASGRYLDAMRTGTVESVLKRALARLAPEKIEAAEEVLAALAAELEEEP